jgi:hypothetical protein
LIRQSPPFSSVAQFARVDFYGLQNARARDGVAHRGASRPLSSFLALPHKENEMSTLNHPSADESRLLNLHASPAPDEVVGALPLQATNDGAHETSQPIRALDALARCMADGALGG